MPIDATNGFSLVVPPEIDPRGVLLPISARRAAFGFSSKPMIWPSESNRKIPICVASAGVTGCAAMVMSARLSMCDSTRSQKSMR